MLDIHAHLHFKDYDADRDAVIARAREAGVETMIIVGTDLESSHGAIALAERYDFLWASVGVHPHEFNEQGATNSEQRTGSKEQGTEKLPNLKFQSASWRTNKLQSQNSEIQNSGSRVPPEAGRQAGMTGGGRLEQEWVALLREMAKHPKVVAIGECGLDYFVRREPSFAKASDGQAGNNEQGTISNQQKSIQKEGFLAQMDIAREAGLPMIIHTRPSAGTMNAYEDIFGILSDSQFAIRDSQFVLHCYQGDTEITKKFLSLPNVHFSFAGNVTYPVKKALAGTKDDILETVKLVPMNRIFVETDCPYLAPQEKRGTRNEPAYVLMTAAKVAEVKDIGVEELETAMSRSLQGVFLGKLDGL